VPICRYFVFLRPGKNTTSCQSVAKSAENEGAPETSDFDFD